MAKSANLLLSGKELQLVSDESWIRMKESILEKVVGILGKLPEMIKACMLDNLPGFETICITSPKISRGERYQGLPYLILDYPREFGKEDVFALRTMFWWAHDFSIHLQLSGKFRKLFEESLIRNFSRYKEDLRLCINEDPWQHDMGESNYLALTEIGEQKVVELLRNHPFIKIAVTIPLKQWNDLNENFAEGYRKICGLLA
ncbi:MAG: hypothetical protein EOO01_21615 [Chitinophagaceae bacterium]|nr:MAG: hypothetical protein EOO01_21615 [Chitinophagaceae bacterium]